MLRQFLFGGFNQHLQYRHPRSHHDSGGSRLSGGRGKGSEHAPIYC